ncbi:MAG: TIGR00159 family protein [Geobacter sp.]|nr:TIGR00159 family protein [Geobacter sp.]
MAPLSDSLTLINFIDKLLVAGLICCSALVVRKEAALRLLVVLAGLFAAESIAGYLGLASTALFFRILLYSAPAVITVIFQGDIRQTLFLFKKRSKQEDGTNPVLMATVDELSKGLHELAERRIGALIVIVRQMSIDHLIQVGTEIDAKVTSELLNSIFLPYSPIHDGAVIIQREKIISAGCFLPLTQNPDIAKSFGTRHRAALGISEQTDVLVLVVSEETGKISIVHDGKITYDADPAEIRQLSRKAIEGKRVTRVQAAAE